MRSIHLFNAALAITGPYYLGYDCPDSCCDRVQECGNLPGSYDQIQTRIDLLKCLDAVSPDCLITAHLGFVAAGFDIYLYRKLEAEDGSNAITFGISYEDIFRAYPDLIVDPIGSIVTGFIDPSCDWLDGCLMYGLDRKDYQCTQPDVLSEGMQRDIRMSVWRMNGESDGSEKSGYKFDSHRMSLEYSHALFYIDRITTPDQSVGCYPALKDESGLEIYSIIRGIVKNIRKDMVLETTERLGEPDRLSTTTTTTTGASIKI